MGYIHRSSWHGAGILKAGTGLSQSGIGLFLNSPKQFFLKLKNPSSGQAENSPP